MENFVEKLKKYFEETPPEKVLEDWEKTKERDNVGITVEEFLQHINENINVFGLSEVAEPEAK